MSILYQELKEHAEALLADARAGIRHTIEEYEELVTKVESVGRHVLGIGAPADNAQQIDPGAQTGDAATAQFAAAGTQQPGEMTDGSSLAGVSSGAATAIETAATAAPSAGATAAGASSEAAQPGATQASDQASQG